MPVSVPLRYDHFQRGTPVIFTGSRLGGRTGVVMTPPSSQFGNVQCALDPGEGTTQGVIWMDPTCMEADLSYGTARTHLAEAIGSLSTGNPQGAHYHHDGDTFIVHGLGFEVSHTLSGLGLDPLDETVLPDGSLQSTAEVLKRAYVSLRVKR